MTIGQCADSDAFFSAALGLAVSTMVRVRVMPPAGSGLVSEFGIAHVAAVFMKPPTPPPRSSAS